MFRFCALVVVLLTVAKGDEDVRNHVADNEPVNSTAIPPPVLTELLLNLPSNATSTNEAPGDSQGNRLDSQEPREVMTILFPTNATGDDANSSLPGGGPEENMTEESLGETKKLADGESPLIRKKRTHGHKKCGLMCIMKSHLMSHKGGGCNTCGQPPPQVIYKPVYVPVQQPTCNVCGQSHHPQMQHYPQHPPPCGGGGCGGGCGGGGCGGGGHPMGGGGSWSQSSSSSHSSSSSGSWGK